jgi:hypothetical protein
MLKGICTHFVEEFIYIVGLLSMLVKICLQQIDNKIFLEIKIKRWFNTCPFYPRIVSPS